MEVIKMIRDATPEDYKDVPDMAWLMIATAFVVYYTDCMRKQLGIKEVQKGEPQ
jgi:hypothetical protein